MPQSASVPREAVLTATPRATKSASRGGDAWLTLVRSAAFVNWAAWICLAVLLAQQTYLVRIATGSPITWSAAFKQAIGGCLLWAVFTPAIVGLSRRFRVDSLGSLPMVALHLVIGTGFCAIDAALNVAIAAALGETRPSFVIGFLRFYPFNITCYLAVVAIVHAVDFARLYRERAVAEAELSAELSTARLRMLESQLRPHFLFNTLNTIAEQVHSNPQGADDMILRLAALLRASLHLTEGHEVPLRDELATVTNYLAIVRARYEDRLRVSIDVAPELSGILVPAMVLQPLVENALQHGVEPVDGVTLVSIGATRRDDSLILTVSDDGAGFPSDGVADGVGLRNTRDRLEHLYGNAARLVLRPREGGGVVSEVTLPVDGAR
jgi:two-component system, LytTR family, sensor kinase